MDNFKIKDRTKIYGLLGAKKYSSRLKNKAKRDFNGRPMFEWNVEKGVKIFDKMFVTSDDDEILKRSEELGAIPIKRTDPKLMECPNITYYKHALKYMGDVDVVVAIQINSPTVSEETIRSIKLMMNKKEEVKTCHKDKSDYGSVWALTVDKIKNYPDPYNSSPDVWVIDESVDIHTLADLKRDLKRLQKHNG